MKTVQLTIEVEDNLPDEALLSTELWAWQFGYSFEYNHREVGIKVRSAELVDRFEQEAAEHDRRSF